MSKMLLARGSGEHGMLIEMLHRRGFVVRSLGGGLYEVTKDSKVCFRGSAGEIHRWLRSKATA
jgi:hypothetical protein